MALKPITDFASQILKPYINNQDKAYAANIAPVETSPATAAHTAGTQLFYNGVLYDVTADIAANDALATTGAGANIAAADKVTEQISAQKQALSNEVVTRATLGAHNLVPLGVFKLSTSYNVTFTPRADGTVVAYSSAAPTDIVNCKSDLFTLKAGSYVLRKNMANGENLQLVDSNNNQIAFANAQQDVPFTLNADTSVRIVLYGYVSHGAYNNVVYYPMIRLASDAYTEYTAPVPTNSQLLSCDANAKLGAHQLIPYPYDSGDTTTGNVTFTVDSDGVITATSTGTPSAWFNCMYRKSIVGTAFKVGETYTVSGGESGIRVYVEFRDSSMVQIGTSVYAESAPADFTIPVNTVYMGIYVYVGTAVSGKKIKPLITVASDTSRVFTPFAKSNKELTEDVAELSDSYTPIQNNIVGDVLTFVNTISEISYIRFFKAGKICHLTATIKASSAISAWAQIGTLLKYLPPSAIPAVGCLISRSNSATSVEVFLNPTGSIVIGGDMVANVYYMLDVTYFIA